MTINHDVSLRERWLDVYNEFTVVARNLSIKTPYHVTRIKRGMGKVTLDTYHINAFYKAIDIVLANLRPRYQTVREIAITFKFL